MSDCVINIEDMEAIARSDDRLRLQELLDGGMDLERTDEFLVTPLAVAAREGAVACICLLFERGAALDAGDPPPAHAAIKAGRVDILEMLLKAGAENGDPEHVYDPDYPPALVVAAEEGNVAAIEALLAADILARSPWATIDDAYWHGLELRGEKKLAVLRAITVRVHESGIDVPSDASTLLRALKPLARAAKKKGDISLGAAVVGLKARLNLAKTEQRQAEEAFLESRFDELFELIQRVSVASRPGVLGVVAASATTGCYCFLQWLLEKGAAAYLCDEKGMTALMHAAAHGSDQVVDPLLYTGQACLNATDDAGQTALDLLGLRPSYHFAHVIERELTHLLNVRRDRGTPPLKLSDAPDIAQRAWKRMTERRIPELLDLLNQDGLDKEDWRLVAGAAMLADSANDCMTLVEYCLDQGADPNARIDSGSNVLHGACEVDHIKVPILRRIVEVGADPTLVDCFGRSVADVVRVTWPEGHECRVYMEGVIAEAAAKSG